MWQLYHLSKTLGVRPSDQLGIVNTWAAYQFNTAVVTFGTMVDNKIAETDKKGRPKYQLRDVINEAKLILSGDMKLKPITDYDRIMAARINVMGKK